MFDTIALQGRHRPMITPTCLKMAAGVILAANLAAAPGATHAITEGEITISLPVYVGSIVSASALAWAVSKFDNKRSRRLERLEDKLDRLLEEG